MIFQKGFYNSLQGCAMYVQDSETDILKFPANCTMSDLTIFSFKKFSRKINNLGSRFFKIVLYENHLCDHLNTLSRNADLCTN